MPPWYLEQTKPLGRDEPAATLCPWSLSAQTDENRQVKDHGAGAEEFTRPLSDQPSDLKARPLWLSSPRPRAPG